MLDLPINSVLPEIVRSFRAGQNVIIRAPTGSGKTTQVPARLLKHVPLGKKLVVVEPRRVACRAAARRVCAERGWKLGHEAGYITRFDHCATEETRLLFVTDGILLRHFTKGDFRLLGIEAIVFDEFHERRLYTDLGLALARRAQTVRSDLRLLVMSATLAEIQALTAYLKANQVEAEGQCFAVEIRHLPKTPPVRKIPKLLIDLIVETHLTGPSGDILVFLPGKQEIATVQKALADLKVTFLTVLPLYGELAREEQDQVFEPASGRKVILATNVAETSLTIPGVRIVIDSGLVRKPWYDEAQGIDVLQLTRVSQASAIQRAGRAGREAPGLCLRLWSERLELSERSLPEIQVLDPAEAVLLVKSLGIKNLEELELFESPPPEKLTAARVLLRQLNALDEKDELTHVGWKMSRYPLSPRLSRMAVASRKAECAIEIATIIALLSSRAISRHKLTTAFAFDAESEFLHLLEVFHRFGQSGMSREWCREHDLNYEDLIEAVSLQDQILGVGREFSSGWGQRPPVSRDIIRRVLLTGLIDRVAKQVDGRIYRLANGTLAQVRADTLVKGQLIVAGRVYMSRQPKPGEPAAVLSWIMNVDEEILRQMAPEMLATRRRVLESFPAIGLEKVVEEECYGELVLRSSESLVPTLGSSLEEKLDSLGRFVDDLLPTDNS